MTTPTPPNVQNCYPCYPPYGRDSGEHEHLANLINQANDSQATREILSSICHSTADAIGATNNASLSVKDQLVTHCTTLQSSIDRDAAAVQNSVERNGADNRAAIERNGGQTRESVERNSGELKNSISASAFETRGLIQGNANIHNLALKDIQLDICKSEKNQLFEMAKMQASIEKQASENTCHIQMEALKNKQDLSTQLAECCCELKEKIDRCCCELKEKVDLRATETNLLLRELDSNRIKEQLAAAQQENFLLKLQIKV